MSIRNFFALIFIISLSIFIYFRFYPEFIENIKDNPTEVPKQHIDKKSQISQKTTRPNISLEANFEDTNSRFIILTSLISSFLSFIGFLISSYYSIIGHKREEELLKLKKDREALEMEKIQAEIRALARGEI